MLHPSARLVLLYSWTFTCEGDGTFRQLMQSLDVGMMGDTDPASKLTVADTGHIQVAVTDRLGAPEQSWYRGPLVSQPLTRDPLGPYHSADQARRVVAETGAENISYASAFEIGRLLAAADGRLAQELMRWRRTAFSASARATSITLLQQSMRFTEVTDPLDPVALRYAVDVLQKITDGISPPADPLRIQQALSTPLLQPRPGHQGIRAAEHRRGARAARRRSRAHRSGDRAGARCGAHHPGRCALGQGRDGGPGRRPRPRDRLGAAREPHPHRAGGSAMREPATTARLALHARLTHPDQLAPLQPEGDLPPYMESFLAHLRLLVGVPFEYLVPDDRLLPPESIRFFYLDRSWTDRLVDGAVAVGQIGSREEAHYQSRASALVQLLDQSERMVRLMQRGTSFADAKAASDAIQEQAHTVTGFVLRSSAVKGWPHMDVRAYDQIIDEPYTAADPAVVCAPAAAAAAGDPRAVGDDRPVRGRAADGDPRRAAPRRPVRSPAGPARPDRPAARSARATRSCRTSRPSPSPCRRASSTVMSSGWPPCGTR